MHDDKNVGGWSDLRCGGTKVCFRAFKQVLHLQIPPLMTAAVRRGSRRKRRRRKRRRRRRRRRRVFLTQLRRCSMQLEWT